MAKKTDKNKCSHFEEMLMWTSYRYCIGRHTYVSSMAKEIAEHYYNKLSEDRKIFTAEDIRREILNHLQWLPFKFEIHRMTNEDELNPIDVLLTFIYNRKIETIEDFYRYSRIEYDAHNDEYQFDVCEPTIKSYYSIFDIEDLIPWEDLASCFDVKKHKMITLEYEGKKQTVRCFKSWRKKCVPCEDKPGYYHSAPFGWEPVWIQVDSFIGSARAMYLNEDYIIDIQDVDNV